MMSRRLIRWVCAMVVFGGAVSGATRSAGVTGVDVFEQNKRLGRGVNVIGYDPLWRDRSQGRFQVEHFKLIRQAGFEHVRINLHPLRDRAVGEDNKLSETWFTTLDWAIDGALANGLTVVLDFHEFTTMSRDPAGLKERFFSIWRQIPEHCKDRPAEVLFEILNEPHDKLNAELWNQYLAEALAIIKTPGTELRIAFEISETNEGGYSAILHSIDQGATNIPMSMVTLNGDSLRLELKSAFTYEGKLQPDGNTID